MIGVFRAPRLSARKQPIFSRFTMFSLTWYSLDFSPSFCACAEPSVKKSCSHFGNSSWEETKYVVT